ncbi:hypothetical protein AWB68_02366 [Caballeronia choica]|jgi:hypothetical protein|uniref:Uncharacterized protein n=1 Tax=Caballeronia choica TaxID=326476 RepID=A0A158HW50_9BURK|nr:hypothetical protein AWB68_02366 [Caballeronia choica]
MSLTVTIIAKLSGVDSDTARRALHTAGAFDDPSAMPPEEFTYGAGARCYALATIADYRPMLFWGGLGAIVAILVLFAVRLLHHG